MDATILGIIVTIILQLIGFIYYLGNQNNKIEASKKDIDNMKIELKEKGAEMRALKELVLEQQSENRVANAEMLSELRQIKESNQETKENIKNINCIINDLKDKLR